MLLLCVPQVLYDDDIHALTCSRDKSFRCWDLRVRCGAAFDALELCPVYVFCFSVLGCYCGSGWVCAFPPPQPPHVRAPQREKRVSTHSLASAISAVALSSDQSLVITAGQDRKLTCVPAVCALCTAPCMTFAPPKGRTCVSPCSLTVVCVCPSALVRAHVGHPRYWDLREPTPVQVVDRAHGSGEATCISVRCAWVRATTPWAALMCHAPAPLLSTNVCREVLQVAHRSDVMATGGSDSTVRVWDVRMGKVLQEGVGHSSRVASLQFSPDDKQLVSVGEDGCVFVWNMYT
jgi:WD40 repeat protein